MTDHIDEFESIFRRAEREQYLFANVPVRSVMVITDRDQPHAAATRDEVVRFIPRLADVEHWRFLTGTDYNNVNELLEHVNQAQTDLIITWRHLHESQQLPQYTLGVYVDVLTQATSIPVLMLPGTAAEPRSLDGRDCDRVMVVTDHISGDNQLINYGVRLCRNGGTIWLCHIEDDRIFKRYMAAIERIPEIDTSEARRLIDRELQREAELFIEGCIAELRKRGPNVAYESIVRRGHYLSEYRDLILQHDIDLVVTNTKDDDQLAMHGIAYSLSIELLDVSLLLL